RQLVLCGERFSVSQVGLSESFQDRLLPSPRSLKSTNYLGTIRKHPFKASRLVDSISRVTASFGPHLQAAILQASIVANARAPSTDRLQQVSIVPRALRCTRCRVRQSKAQRIWEVPKRAITHGWISSIRLALAKTLQSQPETKWVACSLCKTVSGSC